MIADMCHLISVPDGKEVFRKGEMGNALYILKEGSVKVIISPTFDVTLKPGAAFGELALFYDEPRSATIEAIGACQLWILPRAAFKDVSQISARKRLAEHAGMLKKIPSLVKVIHDSLFVMLAEVLEETRALEGDAICTAGDK